jgi:hypothetical protein
MVGGMSFWTVPTITDGTSWVENPFSANDISDNISLYYFSFHTETKIQYLPFDDFWCTLLQDHPAESQACYWQASPVHHYLPV